MTKLSPGRVVNLLGSLLVVLALVAVSGAGLPGLTGIGPVLAPTGIWRLSPDSGTAGPEQDRLPGLRDDASVAFESNGLAHIRASDDLDLFRVTGYLHARFRLSEMDLARRAAGGRLAEILGPGGLESDQFQVELGLRQAAEADWRRMAADDPARAVLLAYADGVNAARAQLIADNRLPTVFKALGYEPEPWTPVDSLLVQRSLTQTLSFSDQSLRFADLAAALPKQTFTDWFPKVPANVQHPYDPGPYQRRPLSPLPAGADSRSGDAAAAPQPAPSSGPSVGARPATAMQFAPLRRRLDALPDRAVHRFGNSNSWAVSGSRTASGGALLATDPHLNFSLPSVWYQVEGRSPGYAFTGVTIPGVPVPLMGKTDYFAWALTNSQRPATLFYREQTDPAHPGQYLWRGQWRDLTSTTYAINVRGQQPVRHEVQFTVHGPVLQMLGVTASVWWAGALPSDNLRSTLDLLRARSFAAVRESMRGWITPAINLTYADRDGNIGALNAGVAPQVGGGADLGLPLSGTGANDVLGSIPFDDLPVTYNPPDGIVVAANQRETTGAYPYQYGTSYTYPDQGWRADEIVRQLDAGGPVTPASSARMQVDQRDNLARQLIPVLLRALDGVHLDATEQRVAGALRDWDYTMSAESVIAGFFQVFNNRLVYVAIRPWWDHYQVPDDPAVNVFPDGGSYVNQVLRGTVLSWLLNDPDNRYFSLPDGTRRDGRQVLVEAFRQTTSRMVQLHGEPFANWRYGDKMRVLFPSLLSPGLDRGPYSFGGSSRAINAAVGTVVSGRGAIENTATGGPTWRFILDWGTGQAQAVYPGGQSENPLSTWYDNGLPQWMSGQYWPVHEGGTVPAATTWRFTR